MSAHSNPIHNKIKKNKYKLQQFQQISQISKENEDSSHQSRYSPALRQIIINVSSPKQASIKQATKTFNFNAITHTHLSKSYSQSNLINQEQKQKYSKFIENQNKILQQKINAVKGKIEQTQNKNSVLLQKYNKLMQTQCSRIRNNIKKVQLNKSHEKSYEQLRSNIINTENKIKNQDSRVKLSDIKQMAKGIDVSEIKKFISENKNMR